jgi:hypothetical protein
MKYMAIIGTAGRQTDQDRLKGVSYQRMVEASIKLITHCKIDPQNLTLVSGGAAWADHIVVTLALMGVVAYDRVIIHLPAELTEGGYVGENEWTNKVANTANYYHKLFSRKVGISSISELIKIRDLGARMTVDPGGFKSRNTKVANAVSDGGLLLAYTFGNGLTDQQPWTIRGFDSTTSPDTAGLKDGGTSDTWLKAKCLKYHCLIGE